MEPDVCVTISQNILRTAQKLGIEDTDALLVRAGINPDSLLRPENRIPFSQQEALWEAAIQTSACEHFGLMFGHQCEFTHFGLLGYLTANCHTVGEALDASEAYQGLVGQGGSVKCVRDDSHIQLRYQPVNEHKPVTPHRVEGVIAGQYTVGKKVIGAAFQPVCVSFSHKQHAPLTLYSDYFGCDVLFSQSFNGLIFTRDMASVAIPCASDTLYQLIKDQADQQNKKLAPDTRFQAQVQEIIETSLLESNQSSKALVADRLNISPRTLQRRLQRENTHWQELLDTTRHDMALALLKNSHLSIAEIGTRLGFAEPSAFFRAFRKRQQQTPGEFRAAQNPARPC